MEKDTSNSQNSTEELYSKPKPLIILGGFKDYIYFEPNENIVKLANLYEWNSKL